jgi:hypothetical protein
MNPLALTLNMATPGAPVDSLKVTITEASLKEILKDQDLLIARRASSLTTLESEATSWFKDGKGDYQFPDAIRVVGQRELYYTLSWPSLDREYHTVRIEIDEVLKRFNAIQVPEAPKPEGVMVLYYYPEGRRELPLTKGEMGAIWAQRNNVDPNYILAIPRTKEGFQLAVELELASKAMGVVRSLAIFSMAEYHGFQIPEELDPILKAALELAKAEQTALEGG